MKIVKKIQKKIVIFTAVKNRCMLHRHVFVLDLKHRLWVLVEAVLTCTHNPYFEQQKKEKNMKNFQLKIIILQPLKIAVCCMSVLSYCNECFAEIKHFAFYFVFVSESLSIDQSLRKIRKHY